MNIVQNIVDAVTALLSGLSKGFSDVATNISGMFWTPGVGENAGSLTILGIFALVGLSMSIIYFIVRLVRSLITSSKR